MELAICKVVNKPVVLEHWQQFWKWKVTIARVTRGHSILVTKNNQVNLAQTYWFCSVWWCILKAHIDKTGMLYLKESEKSWSPHYLRVVYESRRGLRGRDSCQRIGLSANESYAKC